MSEIIQCPDCGSIQYFTGKLKPRAHTRCTACKKDLYVIKNIVPTDYNDNADSQTTIGETDNYTDLEGNIYIGNADHVPTKNYKSRWDPSNLSILRTFFYFLSGKNHRGNKEELIILLIRELQKL